MNIGDRIEFNGRGETIRGTVTDTKLRRTGSRNPLVKAYGLQVPGQRVLIIMSDDGKVWNVPERMAKKIGTASAADQQTARSGAADLISKYVRAKNDRNNVRKDSAYNSGFYSMNKGDDIEIQFRGGMWRPMKFSHLTGSGQVGFYDPTFPSRVRFTPAQFARKPQ